MVIEEHARLELLLPTENNWRNIGENDIIQNSLSITRKCMDDNSFSLGGVYSAQLSVKIRISGEVVNTYTLTSAKVKVYSQYDSNPEFLRGIFWITSVSKNHNIYTIFASDALIWLDSTSYDDSSQVGNVIYSKLCSSIADLGYKFTEILDVVNNLLDDDKKLEFYYDEGIINYDVLGEYTILTPDMVGEISTKNPRDYASWIAQIACGFIYADNDGKIHIGQFDRTNEANPCKIFFEEIELNSCEIADFILQIERVYTEVYDGSSGSKYDPNKSGITIDISDNPFKDGHWQYNSGSAMDIIGNIYDKLDSVVLRPFKLKCHCKKAFELGQKIILPDGQTSIITSIKWQFRGGYTLSCAGKDTRVLPSSAKRSQSAKVKDLAYTKVNIEIAKLKNEITGGEIQGCKGEKGDTGEKGDKGDVGEKGDKGDTGFSPVISEYENTDDTYILKITNQNSEFLTPNLLECKDFSLNFLKCDENSGFADNVLTVCEIDFKVLSYSTYTELSGQSLVTSETPVKLSIEYVIDNKIEYSMSNVDINGTMIINLNHIFNLENGEHNIKVVFNGNIQVLKSESYLKGQNIRILDVKPTGADDYIYMTENNGITLLYYTGESKRIKIPDEIDGLPVKKIESTCFTNSSVTDVVISENVTEIY